MTTIISIMLLIALLAIDPSVPEFSGDLRWRLLQITALMWGGWLAWRAATCRQELSWRTTREMLIAWLLLAWMALTSWASVCQAESLRTWANLAAGVGLFTLVAKHSDDRMCDRLQIVITIMLSANVAVGLLQVPWPGITIIPQAAPPAGLMSNCNLLASLIVTTLPVAAAVAGWWIAAPCLLMLYLTGCKAGLVALIAVGVWRIGCELRGWFKWIYHEFVLVCAVVALAVYCISVWPADTVKWRVAADLNAARIAAERPVTGFGPGTFYRVYRAYAEPIMQTDHGRRGEWPRRLHNDWLQIALEAGVPALAMYVWLFGSWLRMAAATRSAWPLGGGLLALGVCALLDFPLQLPVGQALFWLYGGMITHMYLCRSDKRIVPIRWVWVAVLVAIMAAATAVEIVNIHLRTAEQAKVTYGRPD